MAPTRFASIFLALVFCLGLIACTGDPDGETPDAGVDADESPDVGDDVEDDVEEPAGGGFCDVCLEDSDCDDPEARCVGLFNNERICGAPCTPGEGDCPGDAFCATLEEGVYQCVPATLTCVERCDDLACPAGQFCDPLSGECRREARICDTGCQFDNQCGDPDRFACLGTGADDGETICTTRCNPNAGDGQTLQCPSDFFCVPLTEGGDQGVCYPRIATCTDRCHDVSCPAGENCDPFTGACSPALYGYCEAGCQNSVECGGQDDICLNVGIDDAPHCWQDCTESQICPDGYQCQSFLELTNSICLPLGQQCQTCVDSDCFPAGICNPSTGECMPHPEDCVESGCDDGALCEPASRRCVEIDRPCQGSSWAADCDNVITRCTTRRANTDGICATLCEGDDDCHDGTSCMETQNGSFCLSEDFGGPLSCGTLTTPTASVGRLCGAGAGNCLSGTFCVESGGVPGFCSRSCTDNDCPAGSTCGAGPGGQAICLPDQCQCAGDPGLSAPMQAGLTGALTEANLSACSLLMDPELLDDPPGGERLRFPLASLGQLQQNTDELAQSAGPSQALARAARLAGLPVTAVEPGPPASSPDFIDALGALFAAAGDSISAQATSDAGDAVTDVPDSALDLAAHLLQAVADAYEARAQAFADAGLDQAALQELYASAHRVVLPHDDDPFGLSLDAVPLHDLAQAALELTLRVEAAIDAFDPDPEDLDASFLAIIETPAGLVILGDAADRTYDAELDARLTGPVALSLVLGGSNTYRLPLGANQSVANGVSLHVDLGGDDLYTYEHVADPLDGDHFLPSDGAGRRPADPPGASGLGPVSLSEVPRQGTGRLGIGLLFDLGAGDDTYETLRMGQGAGILGVGALFDDGGQDHFRAESFAQGAALEGLGLLHSAAGDDQYHLWFAGQGFGAGGGAGVLLDQGGDDIYEAVPGVGATATILHRAPFETGNASANFAQGAAFGTDDVPGGTGVLVDTAGQDEYHAGYFAQGYARRGGLAIASDLLGDDIFEARGSSQATADTGGFALLRAAGDNAFNQTTSPRPLGQGAAPGFAFAAFLHFSGAPTLRYMTPGGGAAFDAGVALALFHGGPSDHRAFGGGLGAAAFDLPASSPFARALTVGIFTQTGAQEDLYDHPTADTVGIENDATWRQDSVDDPREIGVGLDE